MSEIFIWLPPETYAWLVRLLAEGEKDVSHPGVVLRGCGEASVGRCDLWASGARRKGLTGKGGAGRSCVKAFHAGDLSCSSRRSFWRKRLNRSLWVRQAYPKVPCHNSDKRRGECPFLLCILHN